MCDTCGCGPDHGHAPLIRLDLPVPLLSRNDAVAARIRARLSRAGVTAINVLGTPGAGKTALLEATLARLPGDVRAAVIVADLATDNDARRLRRGGVPVVALETGTTCHLPAALLEPALERLPLDELELLFVENVGNLVCPALFDLGEAARVALVSVTEGSDKPEKYPVMFQQADAFVLSKTDLLPHVEFDLAAATRCALRLNPALSVFPLSSRSGEGVEAWLGWIESRRAASRAAV